jgi:tetratricopeptide (TPR) repeat protein
LSRHQQIYGTTHHRTIESKQHLARLYRWQGKYQQAEEQYKDVIQNFEKCLGVLDLVKIQAASEYGWVLKELGRISDSEVVFRDTVDKVENSLGEQHPELYTCLENLACIVGQDSKNRPRMEESWEIRRRVLEGRRRVLGEVHPDTIQTLCNYGQNLSLQGKMQDAEKTLSRALTMFEATQGEDHHQTFIAMNFLAMTLSKLNRHDEAQHLHRRALQGRERVFGANHSETLRSCHNLACSLLQEDSCSEEAKGLLKRAIMGREMLGSDSLLDLIKSRRALGQFLMRTKRPREAHTLLRLCAQGYTTKYGPDHVLTQETLNECRQAEVAINFERIWFARLLDNWNVRPKWARWKIFSEITVVDAYSWVFILLVCIFVTYNI